MATVSQTQAPSAGSSAHPLRLLQWLFWLACLVGVIVFPLFFTDGATTTIAVFTLIFAAAGTAWNIFSGYTGYIALGHAAFFGTGCYTIAILCERFNTPGGWEPFAFVPVAGLAAAVIAIPLGAIALRTRRHTFVVITIAMFFIFQLLATNLRDLTNGSTGLSLPFPPWSGNDFNIPFYYVTLVILLLAIATSWYVRHSKYGLELLAIRDDEDRARGLGVRTSLVKLSAFVLSAFFVGMLGAVWAYFLESIYPQFAFDPLFDVLIALMAFLGGLGTISGPLLGALIIIPVQQYFNIYLGQNGYYQMFFGAMFLLVILLLPQGIVPALSQLFRNYFGAQRNAQLASGPPQPGTSPEPEGRAESATVAE
jgi:branched-chain amino acid transport system permease protein